MSEAKHGHYRIRHVDGPTIATVYTKPDAVLYTQAPAMYAELERRLKKLSFSVMCGLRDKSEEFLRIEELLAKARGER